jgi:tetratricopeptide (TPR) repeat protein
MRPHWLAGAVVALAACASAPAPAPVPVLPELELSRADARLLDGCYDCLVEARDEYLRLADGPFRAMLLPRIFEAELLIALREKELAMASDAALARARLVAGQLPAEADAERYLRLVEAVPDEQLGTPRVQLRAARRVHQELLGPGLDQELAWLAEGWLRPAARQYLMVALRCAAGTRPGDRQSTGVDPAQAAAEVSAVSDPPLLLYRDALCARVRSAGPFEVARALVPEFRETSLSLARIYLGRLNEEGPARARAAAEDAYGRFPMSAAVTYIAGNILHLSGECGEALRYYDETLALRPGHEDAGLGRAVCLSFLGRNQEAIAAATVLIDAGADNRIDAYYWRAWNRHALVDLPAARDDVEGAKRLGSSVDVHTLAGIIAHDQDDLAAALADLRTARTMSPSQSCVAAWYLGLVHVKQASWSDSAPAFEAAMRCYDGRLAEGEAALARMRANSEMDPVFKARQIALFETTIAEDRRQMYAAAMNAAKSFAIQGDSARAETLGTRASEDATLASEVQVLREYLADRDRAQAQPKPQVP